MSVTLMATFLLTRTIPTVAFILVMLTLLPPSLLAFVILMQSFSFPIPYSSLERKYLFLTWSQWVWFCSCCRPSEYRSIFPLDFYQPVNDESIARQLPAPSRSYRSHLYTTLMSAPTSQTRIFFVTISSCMYGILTSVSKSSSPNFYFNLISIISILLMPILLQMVDFKHSSFTCCNFLSKPMIPTIICYFDMLITLAMFVFFFKSLSILSENDVVVPLSVYLFFSSFALFFATLHYVAVALNFLIILLFVSSSFLEFIISYPIRLLCRTFCKCCR